MSDRRGQARISILLVDDHAVVREGYRRLLERDARLEVVGEAAGPRRKPCAWTRSLQPHVVVLDIATARGERH